MEESNEIKESKETNEPKEIDVAIAGAGIAGCLAARDLARAGFSVAVFEKGAPEELGHDWWDTVESTIYDRVGLDRPVPPELMKGFNFEIVTPMGDTGVLAEMPCSVVNIDRQLFAQRLLREAQAAGAQFHFGAQVLGPIFAGKFVSGMRVALDERDRTINAKITIDASGHGAVLRSRMPRGYGFNRRLNRTDFVITYREVRKDTSSGGRSILVIGKEDGVKWMSRDNDGLVDVFACVTARDSAVGPKEIAYEMMEREGGVGDEILRGGYVARIPVRRCFDSFVAPGFMLVGDSACLTNPLNGSGISASLWAAHLAAKTAAYALNKGRWDVPDLWRYNYEYKRTQGVKFAKLYMLQRMIFMQDRKYFHMFVKRGMITDTSFWHLEDQLGPEEGIKKLPAVLSFLDHPQFFAKLIFTYSLVQRLDLHYMNYPKKFSERKFLRWCDRTRRLYELVPGSWPGRSADKVATL